MKIGVVGCAGRMGQMLVREIAATAGCTLAGGTERVGGPALGKDLGVLAGLDPLGVTAIDDPVAVFTAVFDQLADKGMLVAPVGAGHTQTLVRISRDGRLFHRAELGKIRQFPLREGVARRL